MNIFSKTTRKIIPVGLCCIAGLAASLNMNARTMKVMGKVTDVQGHPIAGVTVSDSYTAVQTDQNGAYCFERNEGAYYVHYSIPAEYQVELRYGTPCFYKKLDRDSIYNFVLTPLKEGKEKDFNLFFLADPQCQNTRHVRRFHTETIPDLKAYSQTLTGKSYGITLGDIAYTEGEFNTTYILPMMKEEMRQENSGMPFFQTNGNHDLIRDGLSVNNENPTAMVRHKRMFEDLFGPLNYSWNRGDVHIISMDNVMYDLINVGGKYHGEIAPEQLEWLKQDLSFVPKSKMVIFCCHIPMYSVKNCQEVLELLKPFANSTIYSGHIHTNTYHPYSNGVMEYNLAAASGCWWWSNCCSDGTPNGYKVVHINGNKIADQIWKSTNLSQDFQMRMYRGNSVFGGSFETCALPFNEKTILINVFGYDKDWKVEAYENGKYKGELTPLPVSTEKVPDVAGSKDWWAIGYNIGVIGRGNIKGSNRNSYISKCCHMFKYEMKKASSQLEIVATDPYGRKFKCSEIISGNALQDKEGIYKTDIAPIYPASPIW